MAFLPPSSTHALISTEELAQNLPRVKVLDGTYLRLPMFGDRDADKEYLEGHIPGAIRFDIDVVCDPASPYPHMLPSPAAFSEALATMGISKLDHVVCYDSVGVFSAPRVWWMFKVFGFDNVSVLNGGLVKWKAENRPIEAGDVKLCPAADKIETCYRNSLVRLYDDIKVVLKGTEGEVPLICDARPEPRFKGIAPEPRPIPSGCLKGSLSTPAGELTGADGAYKSRQEIEAVLAKRGVDLNRHIICTCGSGTTAGILFLALYALLDKRDLSLYDGSWAEWMMRKGLDAERATNDDLTTNLPVAPP